jgi:hypothetical protein
MVVEQSKVIYLHCCCIKLHPNGRENMSSSEFRLEKGEIYANNKYIYDNINSPDSLQDVLFYCFDCCVH